MSYKIDIYLRDTRDDFVGIYHDKSEYTEGDIHDFHVFLWSEGNFSCDCNRSIFLYDGDPHKKLECNRYDNIIVIDKIIRTDTGEILYSGTATD